eukprot:934499-Alexandrium_andersonii.AAC.1
MPFREHTHRFRRSELELHSPRQDLKLGPRSSCGVRSARLFALIPNLPTKCTSECTGGTSRW